VANFVASAHRHLERTLGLRLDPRVHRVLVNRIERDVTLGELRAGLQCLDQIESIFLAREADATEIRRIAVEQRVDILIQAALKAALPGRLAAMYLGLFRLRMLFSLPARRYLSAKLRPSVRLMRPPRLAARL
jgi:hypothetical protein